MLNARPEEPIAGRGGVLERGQRAPPKNPSPPRYRLFGPRIQHTYILFYTSEPPPHQLRKKPRKTEFRAFWDLKIASNSKQSNMAKKLYERV